MSHISSSVGIPILDVDDRPQHAFMQGRLGSTS
ncbi:unnamed protein product [Chondrus crispus]|uniref:Uncharacterized protein n=1 Tax=Chondrus crispus TaxID=2769 RepID=R7QK01_CHOCR|nr:unnamed protein product [Chondrus crispus]CDF38409.1 unnamed protein product [Chondrus crispus]|eukprot:XP_005718302.1 unnamed protein product [Chondrus crispus]